MMREIERIVVISVLIFTISVLNLLIPIKSFSSLENRFLQKLPEFKLADIISGGFTSDFEKYTTDQFPVRDLWIKLKTGTDLFFLKKDNGRVYFGKDGYLFDLKDDIDEDQLEKNIDYINKFSQILKEGSVEINIGLMLIPSKESVYVNLLPQYAPVVDEIKLTSSIIERVWKDINIIDISGYLRDNSREYIYYKTDHHWTTKGAYIGYVGLSDYLGLTPLKEEDYFIDSVSDSFLGTIYRKANLYNGYPDSIYKYTSKGELNYSVTINKEEQTNSLYDNSFLVKTDQYSYFLGGDFGLVEINTSIKNGKSLIIIKDSFTNSLVPFLTDHYEKITLVDTRYYGGSILDYIEVNKINDVLISYNVDNIARFKSLNALIR